MVVWFGKSPLPVDVWWHCFAKSLEIVSVLVRFCKSLECRSGEVLLELTVEGGNVVVWFGKSPVQG